MGARVWVSALGNWIVGNGYTHVTFATDFKTINNYLRIKNLKNVAELAINAHGKPGRIEKSKDELWCDYSTVGSFESDLRELKEYLSASGSIIFFSCLTGAGKEGDEFLKRFSGLITGPLCVAFTTVLWHAGQQALSLAGQIIDTNSHDEAIADRDPQAYRDAPNVTADSRHAKHARGGRIVRRSQDEPVAAPAEHRRSAESDPGIWGNRHNYTRLVTILQARKQRGLLYAFPYKFPLWLDKEAWNLFKRGDSAQLMPLIRAREELGIQFETALR